MSSHFRTVMHVLHRSAPLIFKATVHALVSFAGFLQARRTRTVLGPQINTAG